MRLLALTGAILLIATGAVWAQTTVSPFDNSNSSSAAGAAAAAGLGQGGTGGAGGFGAGGSSGGLSGRAAAAAAAAAGGSSGGTSANPLAGATSATAGLSSPTQANQNGLRPTFITLSDGSFSSVYGTELFTGTFAGTRPSDRPDYVLQPGDQVVINLYGAVNNGSTQTVDSMGNIFIVGVGPVHVAGISAGQLQGVIAGAVGRVFTSAVSVYTTVGSAGTIGVFVSGDIYRPGRYVGGPHDSLMFFLSQAGGVDASRGSFRNISVRRGGQVVATYDLYDFLLSGRIASIRFEDGDVIFVGPRGPMVGVTGQTRNDRAFEAPPNSKGLTGADLLPLVRAEPTVSGVVVHGVRNGDPKAAYFPLDEFARVVLSDGDHVDFVTSGILQTVSISIEGRIHGPMVYVLPEGTMLSQLLAKVPTQGTNVETRWVHVRRQEVAQEQKRALQEALFNLQKQVLTASPPTAAAAALAASQASLVTQFVTQAQTLQPDGNIAVYSNGQFQDMRLQEGDVVVLPDRTDVVIVTGEVLSPGGLAHADGLTIDGYVGRAGGFAAHANKKRFVLRHRDGSAVVAEGKEQPLAGDEIVVLPTIGNTRLQIFVDLTQILFQIALTTATIVKL
jgi:protein involved in polysaccharide export with SLBB domain